MKITKIMAVAIVMAMVCAGFSIISFSVTAEDSSRPFVAIDNSGLPTTLGMWDQDHAMGAPVLTIGQGIPMYAAQEFQTSVNWDMTMFSVQIGNFFDAGGGTLEYDIRQGTPSVPGSTILGSWQSILLTGGGLIDGDWNDITLPGPVPLTVETNYIIVLSASLGSTIDWLYETPGTYALGEGHQSGDDITYSPIGDFNFKTYMETPFEGVKKVAWDGNGTYAYGVDQMSNHLYQYSRYSESWTDLGEYESGAVFMDIVYSPFEYIFGICGRDSGNMATGWTFDHDEGMSFNFLAGTGYAGIFNGIEYVSDTYVQTFIAVGVNYGVPDVCLIMWYNPGGLWEYEDYGSGDKTNDVLYDVAWDYLDGASYYCVGQNDSGNGVVYYIQGPTFKAWDRSVDYGWSMFSPLYAIDWRAAGSNYGIMCGQGNAYRIYNDATQPAVIAENASHTFKDVDWRPDGSVAILVGEDLSNNGIVYHYYYSPPPPKYRAADVSHLLPGGTGPLYGVAVKGYSSPSSGLIVGPSGSIQNSLSASNGDTTITLNAAFPHIFDIDMWDMTDGGMTSTLNSRVWGDEIYTFMAEVNYSASGADQFYADAIDNVQIELAAWYDDGVELLTPPAEDVTHRTRGFNVTWNEGALIPGGAVLSYPLGVPNEFALDSFSLVAAAGDHYYLYLNITFGAQSRAGDGQNFGFGGVAGTPAMHDSGLALNDLDSWNFRVSIMDGAFPGAINASFEEFGIYKAVNISAAGNPSGNAPPGSKDVMLNNPSQVTYASNAPYFVNVSIARLDQVSGSDWIDAHWINVTIQGGTMSDTIATIVTSELNYSAYPAGHAFAGEGLAQVIWGNASALPSPVPIVAPDNGTESHGPWGSNFNAGVGPTSLQWYATVPAATSEGIYQAQITFVIDAGP